MQSKSLQLATRSASIKETQTQKEGLKDMSFTFMNYADYVNALGHKNAQSMMTDEDFIVAEIIKFRLSKRFKDMTDGDRYYSGNHDILHKKRTAIGDKGELIEVTNLPNNKIVDNQYKKMVNQKCNYLVGQPFIIRSEDDAFIDAVKPYIQTKHFFKLLKSVTKDALNCGIGWLFCYYDGYGNLAFKRIRSYELIPFWADADHTQLESAVRIYQVVGYEGKQEKIYDKVEVYNDDGIYYFNLDGGRLIPEEPYYEPYITVSDEYGDHNFAWDKIPLVPFKINETEVPLICACKSLQDGLNKLESQWEDQMEEDPRNTILVLVNYDGENLGEFRKNLANYGAVKVRSAEGSNGDVKTLQITVNAENYVKIKAEFKKAIIENCMGYDAKDDRLGGQANEMNIKSMYSDIELDANDMETEYQSAMEQLLWYIECHLANSGKGDFEDTEYELIFNRDIMVSESSVIADIRNSAGILSDETLIAQHPWIDDPEAEIKRIKAQKEENMNLYGDFGRQTAEEDATKATDADDEDEEE